MTETWTSTTLAGIDYYGWDLDIDDFVRHKLLWLKFGPRQLWQEASTMVETGPTIGMKPLWVFFFFQQERIGWVVFTSRGNNGNVACHLHKERDSCGCGKRNSSST
jgi:hypothetical protein